MSEIKNKPLRIALLGTRGIPARYGGFETFAEELSTRLVQRGHHVIVFCRKFLGERSFLREYRNVELVHAWTVRHKYLETPIHAFFANFKLLFVRPDVVILCNAANSPFAWMIRLLGIPLAINVDGIERERTKWNTLGRAWYRLGEFTSVLFANKVIGDARVIQEYYKDTYNCPAEMIPYGASAHLREPGETLRSFNLTSRGYILYVSRLEPENNALGVIQAYAKISTTIPLVIVGDAPYADEYKKQLKNAANPNVIFTGYQFAEAYHELQSHALMYIQATEVGGTHPALIEAMAYGNCIIANGTPENKEVLGDAGVLYPKNDFDKLSQEIARLLSDSNVRVQCMQLARQRANQLYDWERITDAYEKLCQQLAIKNSRQCQKLEVMEP